MLNVGGFRLHHDLVDPVFISVLFVNVNASMAWSGENEWAELAFNVSLADMNSFDVVQDSLARG